MERVKAGGLGGKAKERATLGGKNWWRAGREHRGHNRTRSRRKNRCFGRGEGGRAGKREFGRFQRSRRLTVFLFFWLQIIYASVFPYTVAIYLVKAALLIWYYTITPKTLTRCRRALQLISALCVISFLLALGFSFLWCWPVSRNWTLEGPRICIASAQAPTFYITFACHILTDLLIFVYPFPLMRHARLARHDRRAWGIVILFALGFLAIACTLARVAATIMRYVL